MGTFRGRLKYYLFGVGIGCVFTFFIFGNRGCAWLPDNRVKNMIAEKEILVGDSILAIMSCEGIDNNYVYALLEDEGNVDYSKSAVQQEPKEYHIDGKFEGTKYFVRFALGDSTVEVINVFKNGRECSISISNNKLQTLPLPNKDVIAILEANEFRILELAECQMNSLGITEDELLNFHETASIEISQSKPRLKPNPYYVLKGRVNDKETFVRYEIGENRTRIKEIIGITACDSLTF